jgi:hypothetical protein
MSLFLFLCLLLSSLLILQPPVHEGEDISLNITSSLVKITKQRAMHASSSLLLLILLLNLVTHKVRITIPRINLPLSRLQILLNSTEFPQSV